MRIDDRLANRSHAPVNPVRADVTSRDVAAFQKWSAMAGGRRVADAICTMQILGAALISVSLLVAFSLLVFVGFALSALAINAGAVRLRQRQRSRNHTLLPSLSGTYTLDEAAVRIDAVDGSMHTYPWPTLHNVVATKEFIYLMPTAVTGWIIPKRCFASSDEADQFFAFAHNRVHRSRLDH